MTPHLPLRVLRIAVLTAVAALLAGPRVLPAATCTNPVPYDDLAGVEGYCSAMKSADTAGVIDACGTRAFCPHELVFREDMAVFLEQALERKWPDPGHVIGTPTGRFSNDVPVTYGLAPWIEQLGADGITAGCGPPLTFCPYAAITRAEIAVLIAKSMVWTSSGPGTIPVSGIIPAGNGNPAFSYNCVAGGQSAFDLDVPPTHWACPHIHYMAKTGVTAGCGPRKFCPNDYTPRWQMAVFLTIAFALP